MSLSAILVLIVIAFILASLYFELLGAAFTFVLGVVALGLTKVLTVDEILEGFSNEAMLLVIMLLLVGEVIRKSGVINGFFENMMERAKTVRGFIGRVIGPMSFLSVFLNNTPLVAIMIPFVQTWSRKMGFPPSRLLIPLSFAIILGGSATLIGTSNNLIVNSLIQDQKILPDFEPLGMFEFAWVGFPMLILGLIYLWLFSGRLLPDREDPVDRFSRSEREYVVEAEIWASSRLVGQDIPTSGLLNLKGLSLMEVRSQGAAGSVNRIPSTSPDYLLRQGDTLVFTGNTNAISELLEAYNGLELLEVDKFARKEHLEVVEVVVSPNSPLTGRSVREVRFRQRYGAVVLGIHRNGEKMMEKTADIKVRPGDVVLLLTDPGFRGRMEDNRDFFLLQSVKAIQKPGALRSILVLGGMVAVIALSVLGLVKLIMGTAVYLMVLLLTKIANPKEVIKSLDYNLGLIVVMTLALGTALYKTGLAERFAWSIINTLRPFGVVGVMTGIYIVTALIAAYINNKAALTLVFPISLLTAVNLGVDPVPFALLPAFASMGVFLTPHGYQTNLMVFGPGGYRFQDFFRLGFPLTILYMAGTISILYLVYI